MAGLRDIPGFGPVVDGLSWAIGSFDNKDLAFAIALTILAAGTGIWAFLHFRRHRPWVRPIRRLASALQGLRSHSEDAATRLAKAHEIFESEPSVAPLWKEYKKHLPESREAAGYVNLVDPRLWFSLESLPGHGYVHWCATWAGVFLTVGLVFTFIGLSAALLKVTNIAGADSTAMKNAITGILGVSSAKFITSIAGILAYIGFSLVTRRYQSSQHQAVHDLADAIQHLSIPLTPELLLFEQSDIARKQLVRLERFTDDLAVAIDGKLKERIRELSGAVAERLGEVQQALPGATAGPIVDAIKGMTAEVAREFSSGVQQTAGGELNAVAERFAEVAQKLGEIKEGMGGAGQAFGEDIGQAAADLRDAAHQMGQGVQKQSTELESKIGQFSDKLDNISTGLGQIPDTIDKALTKALGNLTQTIDALVGRLAQGGEAGAAALASGSKEASREFKEDVGRAGNDFDQAVSQATGKLVEQLTGVLEKLQSAIQDLAGRLQAVESSLKALPGAVATQVQNLNAAGKTFETAGQIVTGASSALRQAAQPVQQTAAALQTGLSRVEQAVTEANKIQQQTTQTVQGTLDHLTRAAEAAKRTFEIHEKRFGETDEHLERALIALRDGVEQVAKASQEVFKGYDEHISSAVKSLGGVAEFLQEAAEDLGKPVRH